MKKYKDKFIEFCILHRRSLKLWIILLLMGAMIFKGAIQIPQINSNKEKMVKLREQIEYEQTRQSEIDELKTKVDSDEYIEKIASEKLGLVKSNAKIFIDVSENR